MEFTCTYISLCYIQGPGSLMAKYLCTLIFQYDIHKMLWKINIVIRIYKNFRTPLLPFSLLLSWFWGEISCTQNKNNKATNLLPPTTFFNFSHFLTSRSNGIKLREWFWMQNTTNNLAYKSQFRSLWLSVIRWPPQYFYYITTTFIQLFSLLHS